MAGKAETQAGLQDDPRAITNTIAHNRSTPGPAPIRALKRFLLPAALLIATALATYRAPGAQNTVPRPLDPAELCEAGFPDRVWKTIPVGDTTGVTWAECYENKYCARMAVPLDYSSPDDPRRATIALIKVPARVSADSEAYRGPVLFNPGGPGGSGVDFVRDLGDALQQVLGDDYDIVGFDPRGVGFTDPVVDVFPDAAERASWLLKTAADPLCNLTADAVARFYARATVFNGLAAARAGHAAPYVGTASVARDMLGIVHALGYDKIQYWGFSYGSVLGATFASMFPDNVGRLVIDGVIDVQEYYDTLWNDNLLDTENVLHTFLAECAAAGPALCAFHEPTAAQIEARLDALFARLKRRPLAVSVSPHMDPSRTDEDSDPDPDPTYGVVDYALLRAAVFGFTHAPYEHAAPLAHALRDAERGDGRALWDAWHRQTTPPPFRCPCPASPSPTVALDAAAAIACGDGAPVEDSVDELEAFHARMRKVSPFAEVWRLRPRCVNWKFRPTYRFAGPVGGTTAFPLLLVGNTADPVTPVRNAHTVSKAFSGSVVLTQASAGHCSISASSPCTARAIRAYFREGALPARGTVCAVSDTMFSTADAPDVKSDSEERAKWMAAWGALRDASRYINIVRWS